VQALRCHLRTFAWVEVRSFEYAPMIRRMGWSNQRWMASVLGVVALSVGLAGVGVAIARSGGHPPQPIRMNNPIRATIAGGCPRSIKGADGITNPEPDHLDKLLAPSNPTHGLICRYTPLEGLQRAGIKYGVLYKSVSLLQREARRLASDLDRIPPEPSGASYGCPSDIAHYDILILAYVGHQDVDLLVSQTGCQAITNGYAARLSVSPQAGKFATDFDELAGPTYRQPQQ
jgi:hypothetical protein